MPNFDTPQFTSRVQQMRDMAISLHQSGGHCSESIEDAIALHLNADKLIHDVTIESIVHEVIMSPEDKEYCALMY